MAESGTSLIVAPDIPVALSTRIAGVLNRHDLVAQRSSTLLSERGKKIFVSDIVPGAARDELKGIILAHCDNEGVPPHLVELNFGSSSEDWE